MLTLPVGAGGGATGPHVVRMRRSIRIANPLVPAAERSRGPAFEPSSQPTLRWREMDSNFRFRVRCKRGLRRKSPASAACRRRLSGAAGSARDKGFALRLRAEGHRRQTFSVMASTPGGRFGSFNRSTTRASRHVPRAGPALGTALSGASLPWSPSRFRILNGSSCPSPGVGHYAADQQPALVSELLLDHLVSHPV